MCSIFYLSGFLLFNMLDHSESICVISTLSIILFLKELGICDLELGLWKGI